MSLNHGGDLAAAERQYGIRQADWLDMSTGINPKGWPVPELDESIWRRLPTLDEDLLIAARAYYQTDSILAIPGSQFAIQSLPHLFPACKVAIPKLGYQEHKLAWESAGHTVVLYSDERLNVLDQEIETGQLDRVVVINPNNPSCVLIERERLQSWASQLNKNQGTLLIDETFMDTMPEYSMAGSMETGNVIILRSLGKFFGLAGVRLGFMLAAPGICARLQKQLGPWAVSGPAQWLGIKALTDIAWQHENRRWLNQNAVIQYDYLKARFSEQLIHIAHTALFITIKFGRQTASSIYQQAAESGILLRYIPYDDDFAYLRFGLLRDDEQRQRFQTFIQTVK